MNEVCFGEQEAARYRRRGGRTVGSKEAALCLSGLPNWERGRGEVYYRTMDCHNSWYKIIEMRRHVDKVREARAPLGQAQNQKDQKLLIHREPSNRPNHQPELYALYGQKANGRDHLKQRYEHDTKANP
ncbi:unnamed protein product [Lupinus luteus]|uniref:Uncharacterized protein n=1 Tax=Lupinus luteus TaxID=3873 RepID=A0AAV1WU78_LUPLU